MSAGQAGCGSKSATLALRCRRSEAAGPARVPGGAPPTELPLLLALWHYSARITEETGRMLSDLLKDIRYGLRMLMKSRAFTLAAVLSLALGVAANTSIFTVVNALFLNPLPVHEPGRLVSVFTTD